MRVFLRTMLIGFLVAGAAALGPPAGAATTVVTGGVDDTFSLSNGSEPASGRTCLGFPLRNFDVTGTDLFVSHIFDLSSIPKTQCIVGATLDLRARPVGDGAATNDSFGLGFRDATTCAYLPQTLAWGRFLGPGNALDPGLQGTSWGATSIGTGGRVFTLDLKVMPNANSTTTNLVPDLETRRFLDLTIQDDTEVDYAKLTVTHGPCHPVDPCEVDPNDVDPSTPIDLPPKGCPYLSPKQVHMIINGLPPGTEILFAPIHKDFICRTTGGCTTPAPNPNTPSTETVKSTLVFKVSGTGTLSTLNCTLAIPDVDLTTKTEPRDPNAPIQAFGTEMQNLSGSVAGETDCNLFDSLQVRAGQGQGLPASRGGTVLKESGGLVAVNSFFDVTYEIEFVGKAGSPIAGRSGTTRGKVVMGTVGSSGPGVPTLSGWGMAFLALLIVLAAVMMLSRGRVRSGPAATSG